MKKIISLFVLVLMITCSVQLSAQSQGIRAGWHYSDIFWGDQELGDPLNSFYVGFFRNNGIFNTEILALHTGLEYFQNGFAYKDSDEKFVLHYISLPVALRVKLGPVFALGGVGLNFKLAGNTSAHEDVNFFDLPVLAGLGVKIFMITIEARYGWGLLNVYDNIDAKNQYFQIGAGISF